MDNRTDLPALFGRVTMILNAHRSSVVVLHGFERDCARLAEQPSPRGYEQPFAEMRRWRAELAARFAAEESEAYFETIAADCPALGQLVDALKRDHRTILGTVDALHDNNPAPSLWELKSDVISLARLLHQHEAAERELLQGFLLGAELERAGRDATMTDTIAQVASGDLCIAIPGYPVTSAK